MPISLQILYLQCRASISSFRSVINQKHTVYIGNLNELCHLNQVFLVQRLVQLRLKNSKNTEKIQNTYKSRYYKCLSAGLFRLDRDSSCNKLFRLDRDSSCSTSTSLVFQEVSEPKGKVKQVKLRKSELFRLDRDSNCNCCLDWTENPVAVSAQQVPSLSYQVLQLVKPSCYPKNKTTTTSYNQDSCNFKVIVQLKSVKFCF